MAESLDPFGEVLESFRADLRHYIRTMYPGIKTTAVISISNHAAAAARIAFAQATERQGEEGGR